MATSAPFVIPTVYTAIDKFSGPMKTMGNAVQGFVGRSERWLSRANAAFTRLMTPLTNINRMLMGLGLYVGLFTLIRIIKNAIDIFAEFEQENVNLAVVMGTTARQNKALAYEARRMGLAFGEGATNAVRMQHALATLGFEQQDIMKMGRPIITGSAALEGANPERLAGTVGAVINAFDNLAAGDTQHILDVMALSANRTALNFDKLATTLPIVAGPANAVNISFEETVALLGVLSNAGVHVATSATSLKNIFIDSAKKGHTYSQVIENISKNSNKLTYANKLFGKRSVVSALAIQQRMHDAKNGVIALTKEFKEAKLGLTEVIALERLKTFRGAQKLLSAAYEEFILSIEDGNGPLAESLTRIMKVASAMLLLSSTSDQAREAVAKISPAIIDTANKWLFWLKAIGLVTGFLITARIALWAWRGLLILTNIVQGLWSVALGVSAAMGWKNVWALRGNIVALTTLRAITWLAVAAQNALNFAMSVNPLALIGAAIVGIIELYKKLRAENNAFRAEVEKSNKSSGLATSERKLTLAERFMNIGKYGPIGAFVKDTEISASNRHTSAEDVKGKGPGSAWERSFEKVNPKADMNDSTAVEYLNKILKGKIEMNINDPGGHVKDVKSNSSWIQPRVGSTNTFSGD